MYYLLNNFLDISQVPTYSEHLNTPSVSKLVLCRQRYRLCRPTVRRDFFVGRHKR